MTKPTRRKRYRRTCPLCTEPSHHGGLPRAIPFGVPTYWSSEAALAIFEFVDEMRDLILAVYRRLSYLRRWNRGLRRVGYGCTRRRSRSSTARMPLAPGIPGAIVRLSRLHVSVV